MNAWRGVRDKSRELAPFVALGLLGVAAPLFPDYALEVGYRYLLIVALAQAWNLLAGLVGLVSLGTASFFGVGAYAFVGLVNRFGMASGVAIPLSGLAGVVLALALSPAVFRLRGLYFTVGTLAMSEALRLFMVNADFLGGATGLYLAVDPPGLRELFVDALWVLAASTLVAGLVWRSRLSLLLRSLRDDEDAAAQMGVRSFRLKLIAFALAGYLTAMGGALQGLKLGAVEPYGMFGLSWTVQILTVVVLGGQGLRAGPWVGGALVLVLSEALADLPQVHLIVTGALLVLALRYAPRGIAGIFSRAYPSGGPRP